MATTTLLQKEEAHPQRLVTSVFTTSRLWDTEYVWSGNHNGFTDYNSILVETVPDGPFLIPNEWSEALRVPRQELCLKLKMPNPAKGARLYLSVHFEGLTKIKCRPCSEYHQIKETIGNSSFFNRHIYFIGT
jgi:hypothetical protein